MQSCEISHLFFGPSSDHFPRILFAVALSESEFSSDIFIAVLENQNGGLVDLDGALVRIRLGSAVIDIGFFSGRNASVDIGNEAPIQQLEQNHPCSWIHDLFYSSSI